VRPAAAGQNPVARTALRGDKIVGGNKIRRCGTTDLESAAFVQCTAAVRCGRIIPPAVSREITSDPPIYGGASVTHVSGLILTS
jgi:hypothetical protein